MLLSLVILHLSVTLLSVIQLSVILLGLIVSTVVLPNIILISVNLPSLFTARELKNNLRNIIRQSLSSALTLTKAYLWYICVYSLALAMTPP